MSHKYVRLIPKLLIAAMVTLCPARVFADLVATVLVEVTQQPNSEWLYTYNVTNNGTSSALIAAFVVDVGIGGNTQSSKSPNGWIFNLVTEPPSVSWFVDSDPSLFLSPGSTGVFSVRSSLAPGPSVYALTGPELNGGFPSTATGTTTGPMAIPEPNAVAAIAVVATATAVRRRQTLKPASR